MKRLDELKARYNELKKQWDLALKENDGMTLSLIEDSLLDAEDELRIAFMTKMQIEAMPKEYAMMKSIEYSDEFMTVIAQ